jgi:4a-hydroxytetrahydrobiopterin dehydratase
MTDIATPTGWSIVDGKLHREFTFKDFTEAFAFMTKVAFAAEKLNHHPDWSNAWNKVTIDIVSHDKGAITDTCVALAEKANAAAGES